ncbi:hypothetical protein ACFYUV_29685 [Nonomuraea sp. NPDC003560]|uniref:hypothetical protein n=1 Tax=Nonomuraea sp. NPDC003560 TaxID=3364341 RepID=UPI00367D9E11
MVRTSLTACCLAISLTGCAGDPVPVEPSRSAQPEPAAAPQTPLQQSTVPGTQRYYATELRPGDCIEPFPQTYLVTVVPCHVPHSAEFATTYVLPEGPYPDADMTRLAQNGCLPRMRIKKSKRDDIGMAWVGPAPEDWPRDRTVYCLAVRMDGKKATGRVVE